MTFRNQWMECKELNQHPNESKCCKTETQCLGHDNSFQLLVDGQQVERTDNFAYLDASVSTHNGSDDDITKRIDLAYSRH